MNGIIIMDKPEDYTSFDVVAVMRKLLGEKKVGHAGTLDPMATGVLPILLGRATKLQAFLPITEKEYVAKIKLGLATDTLDITGKVLSSVSACIKKEEFQAALEPFVGAIDQLPPMYSAVQKDGVRLYALARKGIEIERSPRKVVISRLELLGFDEALQEGKLLITCSKGTYIRTLCDDIGKKLGCGAVLAGLQRTKACGFSLKDSITLDKAREFAANNNLQKYVLPCDLPFKSLRAASITLPQANRFRNGGALSLDRVFFNNDQELINSEIVRVYSAEIGFIGLGKINLKKDELSVACLVEV